MRAWLVVVVCLAISESGETDDWSGCSISGSLFELSDRSSRPRRDKTSPMSPQVFIAKWKQVTLSERSACHEHFLDVCELLNQPKPAASDPDGAFYTFERGVSRVGGGEGWADVWMRGHFGWEYKGKRKDLKAAYNQLLQYREDLDNPPLLVVCDMDRFEIHTNFTGTAKKVYAFNLDGLTEPENLNVLRRVFTAPDELRPLKTTETVTKEAAKSFAEIAKGLRKRGVAAKDAAHFLMKLMFCMFAEDIELLPNDVFKRCLDSAYMKPSQFTVLMTQLFNAMAHGGNFGADYILYFNGGLFSDASVIELQVDEIAVVRRVADEDWSAVEPSIFGTLFERSFDPDKEELIGAHYTSREDIETLLRPVMLAPLRREWDDVKRQCEALWPEIQAAARRETKSTAKRKASKPRAKFDRLIQDFAERLSHVTVLDPACGSGNFLYVALHLLLNLEKEVITFAASHGVAQLPHVRPTQLSGIEINPYAQELAQVVIWIGYLQWMRDNGFSPRRNPVLEPIESIRRMDAILDLTNPAVPLEPEWPAADFIVGNPPFLGDKVMRTGLGDEYVERLRSLFATRIPGQSDLCCYWFEKARWQIEKGKAKRAGLLATQGIRGGANRETLKRIKNSGDIFFAVSDRDWILDGATVHISMVGFDDGSDTNRALDGQVISTINANLTSAADSTTAKPLSDNKSMSFIGAAIHGPFDLNRRVALEFLATPNVHGKPNSDVVRSWANALTITKREDDLWIIDVPPDVGVEQAALYEKPFEFCGRMFYQYENRIVVRCGAEIGGFLETLKKRCVQRSLACLVS